MNTETRSSYGIDWLDIRFAVFAGLLYVPLKAMAMHGDPGNVASTLGDIISIPCIAYILWRAQTQPEKLREWGLTTPLKGLALGIFGLLLIATIVPLAVFGLLKTGSLSFEIGYLFRMIDYVSAAFPQQFLVFAVGVATLEKLPGLHGNWRLPLILGFLFGFSHFFIASRPLCGVPAQVIVTLPFGCVATWYFLRFRTIVPLVIIHAIGFVLLVEWVEKTL